MKPTRPALLVAVLVALAALAVLVLRYAYSGLPLLPTSWAITPLLLGLVEAVLAWTTRNRLLGRHGAAPMHPLVVVRFVALARASSLVGAGLAGAWIGTVGYLLNQRSDLSAVNHDRRVAVIGAVGALVLIGAALWLEWVCRVRDRDREDPHPTEVDPFAA